MGDHRRHTQPQPEHLRRPCKRTSPPLPDAVAQVLLQLKQELESLPSAQRMSEENAETVYALAYREYGQARYEQALKYFQLLLVYRPTNTVYLLGAALCLRRERRYELASAAFLALGFLEPTVPGHTLALAECQLLNHEHPQARDTLALVIGYCGNQPGHDPVRARAQAMLDLMSPHHEPAVA